mgnify:CR=1 FL=1|tara:strand:- start:179 stop:1741 length:1563 start_codon:yes stop_codon:yes gene_type:complete
MRDIVVVGGGTAGWLAALKMQHSYRDCNITLVKSDAIGILGAGEGATPSLIDFLKSINISEYDLIRHTSATYKLGINFENWNGDGASYFHGFLVASDKMFDVVDNTSNPNVISQIISQGKNPDDYNASFTFARDRKSPFIPNPTDGADEQMFRDDFSYRSKHLADSTKSAVNYSVHFNAVELAGYLEQVAVERGINIIEGIVDNVHLDSNDYIDYLDLDNGNQLNVDFLFDCTGFHRLVTGKVYGSEWESLSEYLPMDQAQPFFLPPEEDPSPWTQAIAQDAGWIWKIPLQNRYGCGYVYDTSYISKDEVIKSIREQYPSAEIPDRVFKFNPGHFKTPLVKNSLAIGLAAGFVEPLEATSIMTFVLSLQAFKESNLLKILTDPVARVNCSRFIKMGAEACNEKIEQVNMHIAYFIQYHYLTQRQDTDFWNEYRNKSKQFEYVQARVEQLNTGNIFPASPLNNYLPIFDQSSWHVVGAGLGHIETESINLEDVDLENLRDAIDSLTEHAIPQQALVAACKG